MNAIIIGLSWIVIATAIWIQGGLLTMLLIYAFVTPGLFLVFGAPVYEYLAYGRIQYAITNKRALFQRGLIGRDFECIDFDKITNAEVDVAFYDRIFGRNTGSIIITSAGISAAKMESRPFTGAYTFCNIPNPYEVFRFFKKVSHDVKTDIKFPNRYRPNENPGYKTDYNPDKAR